MFGASGRTRNARYTNAKLWLLPEVNVGPDSGQRIARTFALTAPSGRRLAARGTRSWTRGQSIPACQRRTPRGGVCACGYEAPVTTSSPTPPNKPTLGPLLAFLVLLVVNTGGCGRLDEARNVETDGGGAAAPGAPPASVPEPASAPARDTESLTRWKRVRMTNTQLFGADTTILEMLVPADWRWQAALDLRSSELAGCPENAFVGHFEATSPDGQFGLAGLPPLTTVHFRLPGLKIDADRRRQMGQTFCVEAPRMSLPEFVERQLVPAFRSGARVTGYQPIPTLSARVGEQLRQLQLPNLRSDGEVGVVTIAFEVDGHDVEERIYLQGVWQTQDLPCMHGRTTCTAGYVHPDARAERLGRTAGAL